MPKKKACEHHYIGGNDGMWCTKCGDEQPLLERQCETPPAAEPSPEKG